MQHSFSCTREAPAPLRGGQWGVDGSGGPFSSQALLKAWSRQPTNKKDEKSLFVTELQVNFRTVKYDFNKWIHKPLGSEAQHRWEPKWYLVHRIRHADPELGVWWIFKLILQTSLNLLMAPFSLPRCMCRWCPWVCGESENLIVSVYTYECSHGAIHSQLCVCLRDPCLF